MIPKQVNLPSRIVSFSSLPDDEIYLSPEEKTILMVLLILKLLVKQINSS